MQLRRPFDMYREGRVMLCLSVYVSLSLSLSSLSLSVSLSFCLCLFVRCLSISRSVRLSVCLIGFNNQMPQVVFLSCLSQTHGFQAWKEMRVIMLVCVCVRVCACACVRVCVCVCARLRTNALGVWRKGSSSDSSQKVGSSNLSALKMDCSVESILKCTGNDA